MDIEVIKSELNSLKAELESRTSRTHRHIYEKEEPVSANFNEQVKQMENDELVRTLEAEGLEEIALIERALKRIGEGKYGACQSCGEDIDEARLKAIPYAETCISCAS